MAVMGEKKQLTLLMSTDSNYVALVATLLFSIRKHLSEDVLLDVFILSVDGQSDSLDLLSKFCESTLDITLTVVYVSELPDSANELIGDLELQNQTNWGPPLCFASMFILPLILPGSVKRAVYIDSDMIALGDIGDLATMSLDGLPAGAVRAPLEFFQGRLGTWMYMNAGFVVMDLNLWRQKSISEKGLQYLHDISGNWENTYVNQDALNVLLKGRDGTPEWKELHPKWNACTPIFLKSNSKILYDSIPIEQVKLLHYCGVKPWDRAPDNFVAKIGKLTGFSIGKWKTKHPHADLFFDLFDQVPFDLPCVN